MSKDKNYGGEFEQPEHAYDMPSEYGQVHKGNHLEHPQIKPADLDGVNNAPPKEKNDY